MGLFSIINQSRAVQGWTLAPAHELEPICRVWWKEFARHNIPPEHYETLYQRALDRRIRAVNEGAKNIPALDAVAIIAGWIGEYGLRAELHQKRIAEGRYLESNAASDCDMCHGGGMRLKVNEHDPSKSGYVRCDHGNGEAK
jgi:hypothetical protein